MRPLQRCAACFAGDSSRAAVRERDEQRRRATDKRRNNTTRWRRTRSGGSAGSEASFVTSNLRCSNIRPPIQSHSPPFLIPPNYLDPSISSSCGQKIQCTAAVSRARQSMPIELGFVFGMNSARCMSAQQQTCEVGNSSAAIGEATRRGQKRGEGEGECAPKSTRPARAQVRGMRKE